MTDTYYERVCSADPQRYEDLLERARSLRTPDADAALPGTSAEGAANLPTDAPDPEAGHHPDGLTQAQRAAVLRTLRHPFLKGGS